MANASLWAFFLITILGPFALFSGIPLIEIIFFFGGLTFLMCLMDLFLIKIYSKKVKSGQATYKTYGPEFTYLQKFLLHVMQGKYNHLLD